MTVPTPFPELKAFDQAPRLPSLSGLLKTLPGGSSQESLPQETRRATKMPSFPSGDFADPNLGRQPAPVEPLPAFSSTPLPEEPQPRMVAVPPSPVAMMTADAMDDEPESTDEELKNALEPMIESSLEQVLYSPDKGLHTYLEPMLRSTVRRAIAEQIDAAVQFRSTGTLDRIGWRLKALLTSRSYDDVVFNSTRRYQVEEAFLLRKQDFSLVSYASHNPARHASPKRVRPTVKSLASRILDADRKLLKSFELPDNHVAIIREGKHSILIAMVRGRSNALVRADLDFVLRQAEERFGERLEDDTDAFVHVLQPILEGCLLIQSPSAPS